MIKSRFKLKPKLVRIIRKFALKFWRSSLGSDPFVYPLIGDRCIEYAFAVKSLVGLDRNRYRKVLDIGCFASPLTTIIKEIGYAVDAIDLLPAPYVYDGVNYFRVDFLEADLKESFYDVVILCSTVEHIGLEGRYGSRSIINGDIKALKKVKQILRDGGILVLTVPYGKEKIIKPLHRVYNKNSKWLKYVYENIVLVTEEFYKKNDQESIWVKCNEKDAASVIPSEDNYALGLFLFKKKESAHT